MISYEEFEGFIKKYYLQSIEELDEMDRGDEEYSRESVILNSEENVMTDVDRIIEKVKESL